MNLFKIILVASFCSFLSACVVVPSVTSAYDETCQIVKQKVELTIEEVSSFEQLHCSNSHSCESQFVGQVVGVALILPLSAIVSGSVAVIGNTMYWLQEQGKCLKSN